MKGEDTSVVSPRRLQIMPGWPTGQLKLDNREKLNWGFKLFLNMQPCTCALKTFCLSGSTLLCDHREKFLPLTQHSAVINGLDTELS